MPCPPTGRSRRRSPTKKKPPEEKPQSAVCETMETVRRRSKVWLHFSKTNDTNAQCITCKRIISCKGGCTTNMIKHFRGHGVTECPVFDALHRPSSVPSSSDASSSDSNPQPTAEDTPTRRRPLSADCCVALRHCTVG